MRGAYLGSFPAPGNLQPPTGITCLVLIRTNGAKTHTGLTFARFRANDGAHARGLADLLLEEFFLMSCLPAMHGAYLRRDEIVPTGSVALTRDLRQLHRFRRNWANCPDANHARGLPLAGSTDFRGTRATLAHTPACPNSDELDLLSFRRNLRIGVDATHRARGLPLWQINHIGAKTHTGLTFARFRANDGAHAPKIVRRCVPIRGDEHAAAVLLHPSTAQTHSHDNAVTCIFKRSLKSVSDFIRSNSTNRAQLF